MITERLHLLSKEVNTKFTFQVDDYGNMVELSICEDQGGVSIPKFAILVDDEDSDEKYVLSVLESSLTVYFGSNIFETAKVFVSSNIEEIFKHMRDEVVKERKVLGVNYEDGNSKEGEGTVADHESGSE
jgi:hypothetical protein